MITTTRRLRHAQNKRWSYHPIVIITAIMTVLLTLGMYKEATALFTDQEELNSGVYTTATLSLEVDKPLGVDLHVANLIPGDTVERDIIITNTGNVPFTYSLYLEAPDVPVPSLLWTGGDGLQFQVIDDGQGTAIGTQIPVSNLTESTPIALGQIAVANSETIRIRVTLPVTANNTYQNLQQALTLVFFAQQLAGTSR